MRPAGLLVWKALPALERKPARRVRLGGRDLSERERLGLRSTLVVCVVFATACLPAIPVREPLPRETLPAELPVLTPCALVHGVVDESLSNGAHGFKGRWSLAYASFLIRHPEGVLLVDAAFGREVDRDLDASPFWFRWLFGNARGVRSIGALLGEADVRGEDVSVVLVTHAHWDHTGGVVEVPNARVVMGAEEKHWVVEGSSPVTNGGMPSHFPKSVRERIDWVRFSSTPYEGFERSFDLFGDGSVVAVPLPGHTPGSVGWFVNSGDGKRWLFAGDAAWVKEGVETPAHKGRLAAWLGEWDRQQAASSLGALHAVARSGRIHVVTSHDERTWQGLGACVSSPKTR